jgi:PBSX family phage terminase large subunit
MELTTSQKLIAKDPHRFRVMRCGRRFGKTVLLAQEMKGMAVSKMSRIAYIANNYQQARDIMWEILKKELGTAIIETNESRLEIRTVVKNGGESYIILRGWESVENLRGQAFDLLAIDEVAQMRNFWVNWQEVLRPTLTDRKGEVIFASTPKGFNHFYDLCNEELKDKDFKAFHFTSYDNPYLPLDELEKAKQTLPADRFEQEYMATFQKTEGLVYKEFTRDRNLYEDLPVVWNKQYQKLGAVDFGYRNPAAVLDVRFNGEKLYIEDEWYKRERTDSMIADYVALQKFREVFPDPENAGGVAELRQRGVNVREVVKGKDSVQNGIQKVREMLLRGDLMINKRCVNLISEFEMYSYDDETAERNDKENPIKNHDHALDALRYVVSSLLPLIERQDYISRMPVYHGPEKKTNPAR